MITDSFIAETKAAHEQTGDPNAAAICAELLSLRAKLKEAGPSLEQCAKDSESRAAAFLFSDRSSEYGNHLLKCAAEVRALHAFGQSQVGT